MKQAFTKYSANGNHFILFDHMHESFDLTKELIISLCDTAFGIGADGVAQITPHSEYAFTFRLWNADGGEAEMCGNAARAAAWHFIKNHQSKNEVTFKTMNAVYTASLERERLWIQMSEQNQDLNLPPDSFPAYSRWYYVNTGVPHLVLEVPDTQKIEFDLVAPKLRRHRLFPKGTNVDFISVPDASQARVNLRVFERGVEGETWSCGTGVAAVAWATRAFYGWKDDISVVTKGGEHQVRFDPKGHLWYSGEIKKVFTGEIS
ncbi:MAG: diaminopimelate epimerase [Bacteriovoracaceae bacterium]|nr:diaminopimelate epimerase [Bacteriovoracaceae bacterium]